MDLKNVEGQGAGKTSASRPSDRSRYGCSNDSNTKVLIPEPISFDRWQDLENRPFPTLSVISDKSELSGIGINHGNPLSPRSWPFLAG